MAIKEFFLAALFPRHVAFTSRAGVEAVLERPAEDGYWNRHFVSDFPPPPRGFSLPGNESEGQPNPMSVRNRQLSFSP